MNDSSDTKALRKYVNKLITFISKEASFNFGDIKIVKSSRIDDLTYCIEGSFPQKYTEFIKNNKKNTLKSYTKYMFLLNTLKKKNFFFPGYYIIKEIEISNIVKTFLADIESDLKAIQNS